MPLDLAALLDPNRTALVTQEIQRGVVGDLSQLPELFLTNPDHLRSKSIRPKIWP